MDTDQTEVGAKPDEGSESRVRVRTARGQLHLEVVFGDATLVADGDADVVLRAFDAFKEHDVSPHRHRAPQPKPTIDSPDKGDAEPGLDDRQLEKLSLPAFLNQFQLKTNPQTAIAIAVWASRQPAGPRQFDKVNMAKFWASSAQKPPVNVGAELGRAANQGWFTKASRGKFDLVRYGEEYVDKTLQRAATKK